MENKKKRFYKKGEVVWVVAEKREGTVVKIDKDKLEVTVSFGPLVKGGIKNEVLFNYGDQKVYKIWEIDKLKYKKAEELNVEPKAPEVLHPPLPEPVAAEFIALLKALMYPDVYFAKVREQAVIPSKRKEDAGYDIYANLETFARQTEEDEMVYELECPVLATTLVPTGLAVAMPDTHYLNLKHERGSTAVKAMAILAGVVDSGFRNEMFVAITPMHKPILISSVVEKVEENETHIIYPLSKAIAQGTIEIVPQAKIVELTYEKLKAIGSERGMTMLGESGK